MSRKLLIEVINGREGPCLSLSHPTSGNGCRIAGPKPWGGGDVIHAFKVDLDELLREAPQYAEEQP